MKKIINFIMLALGIFLQGNAQVTNPVNGVADNRSGYYIFTGATIITQAGTQLNNASLLIKEGKIMDVGSQVKIPADAIVVDCKGKYIYPSFIDLFSDYGMEALNPTQRGFNYGAPTQFTSSKAGPYNWNQSIKPEVNAVETFSVNADKAAQLRQSGFGVVNTIQKDGIARGTSALVALANKKENLVIIKDKASAEYSFNKGTSTQSYPTSLMGSIALLRQTFLDANWYKNLPASKKNEEGLNLSLQAWNDHLQLPQIFDASDKWNCLRADKIGDEFGVSFILKAGGNEYQRMAEMKASQAAFILPLNFPQAMDVEDPNEERFVALAELKHWDMAPTNPSAFEKAGILFCITPDGLKDAKSFFSNLRKALDNGLSEDMALNALTRIPAQLLNAYNEIGSIAAGKYANFIITDGPVFSDKTNILQNWVLGEQYSDGPNELNEVSGKYQVNVPGKTFMLDVKNNNSANIISKDTLAAKFKFSNTLVSLQFSESKRSRSGYRLSGAAWGTKWTGTGTDSSGKTFSWTAEYTGPLQEIADTSQKKKMLSSSKLTYPNMAYGWQTLPQPEDILIKNATLWTNENEGVLQQTDIFIKNGKIAAIGKHLPAGNAKQIDATGMHVTPGIIDEHSHIAAAAINEGGQSVTSEVRIADVINPDDINIYRQLSGGVTTSHILHGSANTIGGQTQLIKLRWGQDAEGLKFKGADPFIKFALGENVKRTTSQNNNRFPDTRMGVQQVQMDAFTRAKDYETALKGPNGKWVRPDLELDALVEIMNGKRFITCHSYVQSEIVETMRIAEKFGFKINTFTHILEGYKVADKLKAHGANASTFSDWWAYKMEVQDAIPYNAGIMHKAGLNVAINSDDAEMARRLNQEAAKIIKYSGITEEEALKMVTLNPAKMLHIDKQVGSLKVGKDADIVIWNNNPLSIYAVAQTTIVDGVIYFNTQNDLLERASIEKERTRLVHKMLQEKKSGSPTMPAMPSYREMNVCSDHFHQHGLLIEDVE